MYLLGGNTLKLFDISVKQLHKLFDINGNGIETMLITGNNMFGTTTGMIIYDITNPQPIRKSTYNHMRSCDPVVVDDTWLT